MKEVEINGMRVPFNTMKTDSVMTENKDPNFIGYSKVYWMGGIKYISGNLIRFYK